jgi:hypothetical protein
VGYRPIGEAGGTTGAFIPVCSAGSRTNGQGNPREPLWAGSKPTPVLSPR